MRTDRIQHVYRYKFLVIALGLILVAGPATSVNLFRWWKLEHDFTLGPLKLQRNLTNPFLEMRLSLELGVDHSGEFEIMKYDMGSWRALRV
ncbi:hypothetical protein B0J14DRAFT_239168 [Halenospora varia]|nr:hypothetical protein B0J14DRAFT_239168 [Halenospora varia]